MATIVTGLGAMAYCLPVENVVGAAGTNFGGLGAIATCRGRLLVTTVSFFLRTGAACKGHFVCIRFFCIVTLQNFIVIYMY